MYLSIMFRFSSNLFINIFKPREKYVIRLLGHGDTCYMHYLSCGSKAMNLLITTLKHRYKFAFYVKIQALFLLILTLVGADVRN